MDTEYVKVGYYKDHTVTYSLIEIDDMMYTEYLKGMAYDLNDAIAFVEECGDNQTAPSVDHFSDDLWKSKGHSIPPFESKEQALYLFMKGAWHICTDGVHWDIA